MLAECVYGSCLQADELLGALLRALNCDWQEL